MKLTYHAKQCFALFLFVTTAVVAQDRSIQGTVTDDAGIPLPGATVVILETNQGTTTDFDGNYSINASDGQTLSISFVGYSTQEITVSENSDFNTALQQDLLEEVVVTALGIKRAEKTLSYASQTVKSEELTQARDMSFANSLTGRAAGVEIRKSSSGAGGSTRIVLRGNKSLSGNSEPLIVIDGVPMVNNKGGQPGMWGGIDQGDGLSQINPDDIESVNILKGANASILYGSQGANGVVLITTKSGEEGEAKVTINSGVTFENVINLPELQYDYGAIEEAKESWSSTKGNYDSGFVEDFFQVGANYINSVSVAGGGKKTTAYFSYYNSTSTGIVPNFKYQKNNVTFKQSTKFLDDKMTISSNMILTDEQTDNRGPSGYYLNPLTGLYMFPRQKDFDSFKNEYQSFDDATNMYRQNWFVNDHHQSNPYWILNKQPKEDRVRRAITSLKLDYQISDKINFQARASYDFSNKSYEQRHAATSNPTNTGANGRWDYRRFNDELFYADGIFTYNGQFTDDISLTAIAGASIQKTTFGEGVNVTTGDNGILFYANEFSFQNLPTNIQVQSTLSSRVEKQALFGNLVFGYKDFLFIDVSGRNDWASTLAGTGNESYFYPSYGLSAIISQMINLPEFVSFAKVRASSATVGNEVPFNRVNPANTITAAGGVNRNTQKPFTDLEPELIQTTEFGLDLRLMNNKIGLDVAYYNIKSTDQFLELDAPSGSGYTTYFVNAGEIVNKGIEISLRGNLIEKDNLSWTSTINFTKNNNEIVELHDDLDKLETGASEGFRSRIVEGGSVGDFYTFKYRRDAQGRIMMENGKPLRTADYEYAGNAEPDFSIGWVNNFTFGDKFSAGFIINGKFGGEVFSQTESMLDGAGVSLRTGQARDNGGVDINGVDENGTAVSKADAQLWYRAIGDRNGIGEAYVYDRTNIRLTQLSLSYNIDTASLGIPVDSASLSLIGNNLLYSAEAPFDPELAMSTNRNAQGLDNFNLPSTRTIGMNLRLTF
ncbi:MAG: SusC/RagA family TonB-linked outer membrane protein [Flavobacteriaceae bacterium]